jgi:Na+/proline symporter
MGIGASIFLIAVGAILVFALDLNLSGFNLDVVGWILMAVGLLGLIMTGWIWGNRRRTVVTREPTGYRRVEERSDYPPDPL